MIKHMLFGVFLKPPPSPNHWKMAFYGNFHRSNPRWCARRWHPSILRAGRAALARDQSDHELAMPEFHVIPPFRKETASKKTRKPNITLRCQSVLFLISWTPLETKNNYRSFMWNNVKQHVIFQQSRHQPFTGRRHRAAQDLEEPGRQQQGRGLRDLPNGGAGRAEGCWAVKLWRISWNFFREFPVGTSMEHII